MKKKVIWRTWKDQFAIIRSWTTTQNYL